MGNQKIVTNKLLSPTRRVISNWNNDFITSDGPNLSAKISLIDLGIPYDSHYFSRIILPAGSINYLLNYSLVDNTTFLLIKVKYNGNYDYPIENDYDPYYNYESNNYNIEYYYEGDSGKTYPIGRLLLLSGSLNNKLEKIYLNNPLDCDVELEVLHANINNPVTPSTSSGITINNLYYSNITTNQITCVTNTGLTGSTAFLIYEKIPLIPSGYTVNEYYIPYNTILSIRKDSKYPIIFLSTVNYYITLKFLSQFDCDQAYSRMMYAYQSFLLGDCRFLLDLSGSTSDCRPGLGIDITPPIIYYNSGVSWSGSGTTIPYPISASINLPFIHQGISGWTLNELKGLFISGITDCWDGIIDLSTIIFNLYENGSDIVLTGITKSGIYNIEISVTDNAGNKITNYILNIKVDNDAPVVVYKYGVLTNKVHSSSNLYTGVTSDLASDINILSGFSLRIKGFDQLKINRVDIIDNIVDYVYDLIDIDINKYMLDVLVVGSDKNVYSVITEAGNYCVRLKISDKDGNEIINPFGTPTIGHYLMMNIVFDESVFSEGYWQDDKVWIDTTLWLDAPKI